MATSRFPRYPHPKVQVSPFPVDELRCTDHLSCGVEGSVGCSPLPTLSDEPCEQPGRRTGHHLRSERELFLRSPIPAGCEVWAVCVGAERVGFLGELAGAVRKDCGGFQNVSLVVSQCGLA